MEKTNYNLTNLTNAQLIVLSELCNELRQRTDIKLNGKIMYALTKNEAKNAELFMRLHFQRAGIFAKHGDRTEEAGFVIREEEREECNKEIQEFAAGINAIELHKVPVSMLDQYELDLDLYSRLTYTGMFQDDVDTSTAKNISSEPELLLG